MTRRQGRFAAVQRRTGTLWDSRYKSSLIQAETYLLACQRYIELNPVRAAMLEDPAHYRWTRYRSNALGQAEARITPHQCYQSLGRTDLIILTICDTLYLFSIFWNRDI